MISLINDAGSKLLSFLCQYPTRELTLSEIAQENEISKPWVLERLNQFEEENIVKIENKGNLKSVRFNRDSDRAKRLKRVVNLERFYNSGILDRIIDSYSYPEAVILFGSFAQGEDVEDSDIDVAVVSDEEGPGLEAELMGRKLSLHHLSPEAVPDNMKETLANGLVVYGYLEI